MIAYHTSRGINYDCDCEFCVAKKQITYQIGNAHYLMRTSKTQPQSLRPYCLDSDAIGNWIWQLRRTARREAREELNQLKER